MEELANTFKRGERAELDHPLGTFENQVHTLLEDLRRLPRPPKVDVDGHKFDRARRLEALEALCRGDGGAPKPSAACQEAVVFWKRVLAPHAIRLAKVAEASERHLNFLRNRVQAQCSTVKLLRSALEEVRRNWNAADRGR